MPTQVLKVEKIDIINSSVNHSSEKMYIKLRILFIGETIRKQLLDFMSF